MLLEEIPAGPLHTVLIWGRRLKEAPFPTSTKGNMANCTKVPKPPSPVLEVLQDTPVPFYFPPASHMVTFFFSKGRGSAAFSGTLYPEDISAAYLVESINAHYG